MVATGDVEPSSEKAEVPYDVCGEAKEVDLVPKMRGNILLSTGKFSKEGYVSVHDKEEVNIYNATTTDIYINRK